MSHEEDLIDYSDEEIQPTEAPANGTAAAAKGGLTAGEAAGDKKRQLCRHSFDRLP